MNAYKRFFALILSLCMVLSFVPVSAMAVTITEKPANGTTVGQPFAAGTANSDNFRIPGLVTLDNGRVIATIDARWSWIYDAGGIDTLVSVSDDNGANWTYTFANYLGDNGDVANNQSSCFIDPAIATDGTTAYMIADLYPAGFAINSARYNAQTGSTGFDASGHLLLRSDSENNLTFGNDDYAAGAKTATYGYYLDGGKIYNTDGTEVSGYSVDAYFNITGNGVNTNLFFEDSPYKPFPTDFLYMTKTTDGLTWSEPELLNLKAAEEQSYLVGPGNGTYDDVNDRLVFTAYRHTGGASGTAYECTSLIWMDANGNWKRSEDCTTANWSSEASCVVLADGTVRVFYRDGFSDLRYTDMVWDESAQNYVRDPDATEVTTAATKTTSCQLSAIRYSQKLHGKDAILVTTANGGSNSRTNGYLYVFLVNDDNSMELTYKYDINPGTEYYAYSCLTELNNGDLGLLWESASAAITYSVLDWDEVTARENNITLSFKDVYLNEGESASYTDKTGDYSKDALTGLDTDVATVTMTGVTEVTNSVSTLGTGTTVATEDCLFTFTESGGYYVISRDLGDGTTVYLNHFGTTNSNIPLTTSSNTVAVSAGANTGMFKLVSQNNNGSSDSSRTLHFHMEAATPYWNRCGNDTTIKCQEYLFRPAAEGDTSSTEIPGYVQLTSVGEIENGGQYLIAAKNDASNWYVLNPTTASNHLEFVAQVQGQSNVSRTEITITGEGGGTTEVQIGNVIYTINVTEVLTKDVQLDVNGTATFTDDSGYYVGADTSALDEGVATVAITGTVISSEKVLSQPVTSLVSGKKYLFLNTRSNKWLSNTLSSNNRLSQTGNLAGFADGTLWTVTETEDGYYVQDPSGKYLTFAAGTADLSDSEVVVTITTSPNTANAWQIGYGGQYLNDHNQSDAGGYYANGDGGSQWIAYEILDKVTDGTTEVTFTGVADGATSVRIGDTLYNITVGEIKSVNVTVSVGQTVEEKLSDSNLNGSNAGQDSAETAQVTWSSEEVEVDYLTAQLGSDANYNGDIIDLNDCLYTFTKNDDGRWTISSTDKDGNAVYLYPGHTTYAGYPQRATAYNNLTIAEATEDDCFTIMSNDMDGNGNTAFLYFDRSAKRLDRVADPGTNATWLTNVSMRIYKPVSGEGSGDINGYERVTSLDDIVDGQYLIVGPATDGGFYALYPNTATTNQFCQLAKITGDTATRTEYETTVTIKGVAEGTTSVTVGNTQYNITVEDNLNEVEVTVGVGLSTTITDDTGNYENAVDKTKLDESIATVTVTGGTEPATKSLSGAVTAIESGKTYVLLNTNANKLMNNEWADASVGGGGTDGLALSSTTANFQDKDCWTITAVDGGYYVQDLNGKYLTVDRGSAGVSDTPVVISLAYDGTDWTIGENGEYLNDFGGANTAVAGWSDIDDTNSQWEIYEVVTTPAKDYTEITFKGVSADETSVIVGNTRYIITVEEVQTGDVEGFNAIVGATNYGALDLTGKVLTKLTISAGSSFTVGVDIEDADSVVWSIADTNIATVDPATGVVTAVAEGETTLTVTVTKGNVSETITIPVEVLPSLGTGDSMSDVCYYVDEITNTKVWYTLYADDIISEELVQAQVGQVIYLQRPASQNMAMVWLSAPEDGYALTYMAATNTQGEYYPLHEGDYVLEKDNTDYYAAGAGGGYNSVLNYSGKTQEVIDAMLTSALGEGYRVDGAMSTSRAEGHSNPIYTSLSFISEKLPTVEKKVYGVLGGTHLATDWALYEKGMYAEVGEVVFFEVKVTIDRPLVWDDENPTVAALKYTNAELEDIIGISGDDDGVERKAYFYSKDLDVNPYDGIIDDQYTPSTTQDIKDAIMAEWGADEQERVLTYYVTYQIQGDDKEKLLQNKADLSVTYSSKYSAGVSTTEATANADMHVLGENLGSIILDFGLPVTIYNLSPETHFINTVDQDVTRAYKSHCWYGEVTINKPVATVDDESTPYDDTLWSVTYIPDTPFEGNDVVYLFDKDGNLVNSFLVYPASTIHYEESFADFGNAVSGDDNHGWTDHDSPVTGNAQLKFYDGKGTYYSATNFGYTGKYAGETGMSNDTEAVSTKSGDTATFRFTGTGFDIYANCDTDTSVMAVLVYKIGFTTDEGETEGHETITLTKFYQVASANKGHEAGVVAVPDTAYGLPLVSVTDMPYGHYEVVIRHTKPLDDTTAQIRLDGYRVYNTMLDGDQYYPADEKNPTFTELRDEVLTAINGVTYDTTVDQIYSASSNVKNANVVYLTSANAENLLEYGPKNEIWMNSGNTLSFVLNDTVGYAQIGLKAPNGSVTCKISMLGSDGNVLSWQDADGNTVQAEKEYTITSATDMFYYLPDVGSYSLAGLTVSIEVTSTNGMLSVTKLKTTPAANSTSEANVSPLAVMSEAQLASVLDVIFDRKPTPITSNVTRIYGDNRFETAFKVADELKTVLGVEKFENIIVASGTSFADALSGCYLATVKNAPILLSYDDTYDQMVRDYIAENLAENGTVYILGGEAAVAASMDDALISSGVSVKRLAGANRFDTNLAILAEAGVENEEILVCTGTNFADSLSASATGKPILLVYNESGKLTEEQAKYLAQLDGCTFTVIGGEAAVSADLENAVAAYGTTKRIAGENRFQTSVAIAETYMSNPENVVLAYAGNYPDGLCGGVLAHAMQAPLVLTMTGYESYACAYVNAVKAKTGVILGGSGLISDNSIVNIFNLTDALEIIVK